MLDDLSHTELVQVALNCDVRGACRAIPREVIIEALQRLVDIEGKNPLLDMRDNLSAFLKEEWEDNLDIQKPPGRPCPECVLCTDIQIVACYAANKDHMALWRPKHA